MNSEFQEMANEIERIANATDFNGVKMLNTQGVTSGVFGIAEDNQMLAQTQEFTSAFTEFVSGETLTVNWTNADGSAGSSSMTVYDATSIGGVMNFMEGAIDPTTSVAVAWGNDGLTVTDMAGGDTQFNVQFSGGGSYAFTEDVAGTDGQTKIHFGTGNVSTEDYYYVNNQDMTKSGLGISGLTIATQHSAQGALEVLQDAIVTKDQGRAHFGAMMNRLQNTVTNLTVQAENIQAAEAQISDVDVAYEMTVMINNQIKAQAAIAMLAQANTMPQMALQLLGG
jgi:flagellin-like hook-associated protein FlgL